MKHFKNIRTSRLAAPSVAIGLVAVLAIGGGAFAAGKITGKDIKNETITGKDVKDGTLRTKDLSPDTVAGLRGATGATGATGAQGEKGATGEKGAPGTNGTNGAPGTNGTPGTNGKDGKDVGPTELGVARLYYGTTAIASSWSGDVPDDGNNAAQVSGTTVVQQCVAGQTITLRAVMRSDEEDGGQAGAGLVITDVNGQLIGADQTADSTEFPGKKVVDVPKVAKNSNAPDAATPGVTLVSIPISSTPAGAICVVSGTAQFFDFDDSLGNEG